MHVSLSHPAPGGRRTHQWSFVGTTHRQTSRHGVPFGDQTFDLEVQVGEGRAQHVGQSPHRLGTTIHPGRGFVVYEVGSDQLVCNVEDPLVQQLFVRTAKLCLVAFLRVHAHFLLSACCFVAVILHSVQSCYNTFHCRVKRELRES